MTASSTRCWKKIRPPEALSALLLLLVALLGMLACRPARAEPAAAQITQVQLERAPEAWLLSATVRFDLPPAVEEALHKGIPLIFVVDVEIFRDRWYWTNKRVATAQR
ncbi:MAG: DUF4390 domain-containing protein, partial [Rhodoferax sp.]|nr:DUF4390 domain-containing protein [Rhodoferax sp.]